MGLKHKNLKNIEDRVVNMGKKAKEHRKKVAKRNERIMVEYRQVENLKKAIYYEAQERYKQSSGQTTQQLWKTT